MSIQNKYDLVLLGNVIIDEVYCLEKWPEQGTSNKFNSHRISVGGIGNIVEALSNSNLKIAVECSVGNDMEAEIIKTFFNKKKVKFFPHFSKKPTSKALILSNIKLKERTSFVNWGCGTELFSSNKKSKWTHISYLDIIPSIDLVHIKKISDVVSADLCLSNPNIDTINMIWNQLQYLDYLFISESELTSLIKGPLLDLITHGKLKCLIFHSRQKTLILKNTEQIEVLGQHAIIDNVDVLGAGDAYCANFILYQLNNKVDEVLAVDWAHKQATKFVLSNKHEKI